MSVKGLDSLQKRLEKLKGELEDAGTEAADDALNATERNAKRRIVEEDAVTSTDLYRGFVQTTVEMPNKVRKRLGNEEAHANVVEWGSGQQFGSTQYSRLPSNGPYKAPSFSSTLVNAIREWIVEKPSFRPTAPYPEDAAIGIAQGIAGNVEGRQSGTPPQPFMRPAWRHGKRVLKHQAKKNVREAVN